MTLRYRTLIGVGGIGAGTFFAIDSNCTLGREESRGGRFLDQHDYCKLHIIAHCTQSLLGPDFETIALGRVGDDDTGRRIVAEMAAAGLDVRYVEQARGEQTLFSFCFLYPDGSGGNLTTADSASARVDAAFVGRAESEFRRVGAQGIALAAPETPLASRAALLELATRHGLFRAASFTAEEIPEALKGGLLRKLDLVALNRCEAETALRLAPDAAPPDDLARGVVERLAAENSALRVSVTAGASGSWLWDGSDFHFQPALRVTVRSTAGAGDAHLGALLAAAAVGLEPAGALQLATLAAAYSVTSPHTIHPNLDRKALREFAAQHGATISPAVHRLLQE